MKRRDFLRVAALGSAAGLTTTTDAKPKAAPATAPRRVHVKPFEFDEVTITELQARLSAGKVSSVTLVRKYLERIHDIDKAGPAINAIIEINPDALAIAEACDRERKEKGPQSRLHGIPVVIKDNIDTHDRMMTTAGSLALLGSVPPRDAFLVERLRTAGAVIIGKANLSEWANFRGNGSTSGWSGRGGLTRNPYVLDRNPSGSSSGSGAAVAANLCVAAIGTETDGSITSPSAYNGIVGLKPTLGLVSRSGIIPIAHSQDTAGPMARTVSDVAILLGAIVGADPRDAATTGSELKLQRDYTRFLEQGALRGARLGVARKFFGFHAKTDKVAEAALAEMKRMGAELIDFDEPLKTPELEKAEDEVLHYEMKADMNAYLASLGPGAPARTLKDLIEFNERHRAEELRWFGQENFTQSEAKGPLTEQKYLDALATCRRVARDEGIDAVMQKYRLDAIVAPTSNPAHVTDLVLGDHGLGDVTTPAAVAGYPHITVPMGQVFELPVGMSFFGRAWSEQKLLGLAFAFEQGMRMRRAPRFLETVG
jgi:amidase